MSGTAGPCFNWEAPAHRRAPSIADARRRCRVGRGPNSRPEFSLEGAAPDGPLASLLTCAGRIGESLTRVKPRAAGDAEARGWGRGRRGRRRGRGRGQGAARGLTRVGAGARRLAAAADASSPAWGLLVLSDSPALPSLASALPALRGLVVTSEGAGRIGHSAFTKSCSASAGCEYGADPGGAWTRSVVDFYLAGCVDGLVRALINSPITDLVSVLRPWSTM